MASSPKINLLSRDFQSIRQDLEVFLKAFYPDVWRDFSVVSPGMAMVDLNAYVADLLSFIADKKYNENYLDGVQERKSVYRLAKTLGYKPPGFRPALCIADISIEVPPTADGPNPSYIPLYRQGMQINGAGQVFETEFDIDFSNDFSEEGVANRLIEPILNGNQDLVRYKITKREKIRAGFTRIYSQEISEEEANIPFFKLTLPESNVLDIISVIIINQQGITEVPSFEQFNDDSIRYFEVSNLPESRIFTEDPSEDRVEGVAVGIFKDVEKRFEKRYLADGKCTLQFGSGTPDYDSYNDYLRSATSSSAVNVDAAALLDNTALGEKVPANSTVFVKYRTGGGLLSNVGANTLTEVGNISAIIGGADASLSQAVLSSTRARNPIPAVGGANLPSVDEIKFQIAGNFASQDRCVTLRDYVSKSYQIPSLFGAPFRIHATQQDNKVILYILSINGSGKLVEYSSSVIKNNLVKWLSQFRMINDFVEINDGKVINLQFEADLFVDKTFNTNEVKSSAIVKIRDMLSINKMQMNENIYISQITDELREIPGVINVVDIRVFNMEGGKYSSSVSSQATINRTQVPGTAEFRTQFEFIDNAILGSTISMFEIRYPERDIIIRTN